MICLNLNTLIYKLYNDNLFDLYNLLYILIISDYNNG